MAKYKYKFIGEEKMFFPTLGIMPEKDEIIDSDEVINSPLLQDVTKQTIQPKDEKTS